jgi:hypothetical protein
MALKSGQAMLHVGRIPHFALFPIIDNINACRDLLPNHLSHCVPRTGVENLRVRRDTGIHHFQHGRQVKGTGQTSCMGRENAIRTVLHHVDSS